MKYSVLIFSLMLLYSCDNSSNQKIQINREDPELEVVTEQDAIRYEDQDSLTRALIIDSTVVDTLEEVNSTMNKR